MGSVTNHPNNTHPETERLLLAVCDIESNVNTAVKNLYSIEGTDRTEQLAVSVALTQAFTLMKKSVLQSNYKE